LNLANNFLDYDSVRPLGRLGDTLTKVDLSSNQVADSYNYPKNLFDLVTSLKVVDGKDQDSNVLPFEEEDDFKQEKSGKKGGAVGLQAEVDKLGDEAEEDEEGEEEEEEDMIDTSANKKVLDEDEDDDMVFEDDNDV
jgi:hypothetical protein